MSDQHSETDRLREALSGSKGEDQQRIARAFLEAADLCLRKNSDYGSSAWAAPVMVPSMTARDAILVRMEDKWRRMAQLRAKLASGENPAVEESFADTLRDLGNYAILWGACPTDDK